MSRRVPLQIGRQSGAALMPAESIERLVNGYLEVTPEGKEPAPVYGVPGLKLFSESDYFPVRGELPMNEDLYTVRGVSVQRVGSDGVNVLLGTIDDGDLVDMATDGTNLVIVVPETGRIFVYNGTTLGVVTDPDAPSASTVDWVDGYFIFSEKDSDIWAICDLGDPYDFAPLAFASAEWRPDKLVKVLVAKRDVFLMGTGSIEAWRNTGVSEIFPFERLDNVFIDVGVIGRFAATYSNDAIFWLANDLTVRRLDGVTATPIQTAPIAKEIASWADPSLTKVHAHVWGDHLFVSFINPDGCVVWDQRTQRWAERETAGYGTWRARSYAACYGKLLFGDSQTGDIYEMDNGELLDGGENIALDMTWPYVWNGGEKFTTDMVEVIAQVGIVPSYIDAPIVQLTYTNDGQLWSAWRERTLGLKGDYQQRLTWQSLGQARQRAYRLRITDPCKRAILSAYAELEPDNG